ncbi:probable (S)-N-methylcoclaurine 3'-hydroxylase isozyme 2 [Rutidosis leptorrhynchoides]|uniref:probable (S)-N-methylcoclaurine 3'-hydroxylase isozyme 2 n=1 Tax=Rutidosis leptorrhynchoides TaxID=125765 RepID=UPI003A9A26DA
MDITTFLTNINLWSPFFLLSTIFCIFFVAKLFSSNTKKTLPPGPPTLPIIGNLHQVVASPGNPHIWTANFAKKYGPLISVQLGKEVMVVASSPEAAIGILKTQDHLLSARAVPAAFKQENVVPHSLLWADSDQTWKSLRTLSRSEMFSAKALEAQSQLKEKKVEDLLAFLRKNEGRVIDIYDIVFTTLFNTLSSTIFGVEMVGFAGEQGSGHEWVKDSMFKIIEYGGRTVDFGSFFPILERFDLHGTTKGTGKEFTKLFAYWDEIIEERRARVNSSTWSSDQAQSFLDRMLENKFANHQIHHLSMALFIAGTNTTTSTVVWGMTELVKNKKVMSKIAEEIKTEFNSDQITISDLSKLSYLQVCIKEIFRLHPPVPLLLPHRAAETCEVMNYTIPKNAKIFVNLWAMGRDPKLWDEPLSFNPERFVDSKIDFKGQHFELLPFGTGRRMCPGLPSGIKSVELILASLIREFDWTLPNDADVSMLDMEEKFGVAMKRKNPLKLVIKQKQMHSNV